MNVGDPVVDTILFDLDGTLYPIENGYEGHIRNRLLDYMNIRLGVPRQDAHAVWWKHFQIHNQSLKGLRAAGYQIDTEDYWCEPFLCTLCHSILKQFHTGIQRSYVSATWYIHGRVLDPLSVRQVCESSLASKTACF
jgi:hypothetical protein